MNFFLHNLEVPSWFFPTIFHTKLSYRNSYLRCIGIILIFLVPVSFLSLTTQGTLLLTVNNTLIMRTPNIAVFHCNVVSNGLFYSGLCLLVRHWSQLQFPYIPDDLLQLAYFSCFLFSNLAASFNFFSGICFESEFIAIKFIFRSQ